MLNRITILLPMSLMSLALATDGATGGKGSGSGITNGGNKGGAPGSVKGSNGVDPSANRRALRFSPGQRVSGRPLLANPQVLSAYKTSMNASINWLVNEQSSKGHWPNKGGRVADTGLAILCLLSYGVLPQDKTPAGTALATGLDWLTAKVQKSGDMRDSGRMYSQAIGTWALGEAYNLSQQAQYKQPMENAAEFLMKAQHQKSGGWRYTPPPFKTASDIGDTSVGGWAMPAVASAKLAGAQVPKKTIVLANNFLDAVSGGKPHPAALPLACFVSNSLAILRLIIIRRDKASLPNYSWQIHLPRPLTPMQWVAACTTIISTVHWQCSTTEEPHGRIGRASSFPR